MKHKTANIPMKWIGPIQISGHSIHETVNIPLATFETPLWPSTDRGARVSRMTGGIHVSLLSEGMTRSILLEADSSIKIQEVVNDLTKQLSNLQGLVEKTSRFTKLISYHTEIVGNLLYLRLTFSTGDAAGHNMVTKASEAVMNALLAQYPMLRYVSISANLCTDKKVSAVNGILGRGKSVTAEILIPEKVCQEVLKVSPESITQLNIKKNLLGSILAGSLRSSNAHFANILLAFYLATGQDAANIVEGSQGITYTEIRNKDLYFSVTLPNLIVGTVGNGKELDFVEENLRLLRCLPDPEKPGESARRLAKLCAACVLCAELSLLAAQANPGELVRSHMRLERLHKK